jgi:cobalt-zinc-cadmium resistance protein CzcA
MIVVSAALALIFGQVLMTFGSLRPAMRVYSGIPLAVTGDMAALRFRGIPFSITAAFGFIALSDVVMVSGFNDLREEGLDDFSAVREGALNQLRLFLKTSFVAALGFVPIVVPPVLCRRGERDRPATP